MSKIEIDIDIISIENMDESENQFDQAVFDTYQKKCKHQFYIGECCGRAYAEYLFKELNLLEQREKLTNEKLRQVLFYCPDCLEPVIVLQQKLSEIALKKEETMLNIHLAFGGTHADFYNGKIKI